MEKSREQAADWFKRVRLRHLEILLTIAEQGSVTGAAQALAMTQPAASQFLADIEAMAGVPLFTRGRRLTPTPYAAPLIRHAELVLGDSRRMLAELDAMKDGGAGLVRIGVMLVAATSLIPKAVTAIRKHDTALQIQLIEDVASGLWSRFERNELDVIVGRLDERARLSGYPQERLFKASHRVVCRPEHPLLGEEQVSWQAAGQYPWIMPPVGTTLRTAIEITFAKQKLALPTVWVESISFTANQVLFKESDCLGVVSSTAAEYGAAQGSLTCLPLSLVPGSGETDEVGMVWKDSDPRPILTRTLQSIREAAKAGNS